MIAEGRRMPIGAGIVVDRRRLLDLVDQMRAALPNEIREAEDILQRRAEMMTRAEEEAAIKLRRAQEQVDQILEHDSVVREAQARAEMLVREAEARCEGMLEDTETQAKARMAEAEKLAGEQMDEADRYAMDILQKLNADLEGTLKSVRVAMDAMQSEPVAAT
jgi:cell division septum initiation protein DivIVA